MLSPEYYDNFAYDLLNLYSKLDESITRDIARRIVKSGGTTLTDTAKWQAVMAQESGLLYDDIISMVAQYSNSSDRMIRDIFEQSGIQSIEYDNAIYEKAGLTPLPLKSSPAGMQRLKAGIEKTSGDINNLTRTTALSSQTAYISACSLAELQVTSGAFNYQTAIKNAVKSAVTGGNYVLYPSGHRDRLDVAVRRSVLTGVSQTCGTIGLMWANDMGCDLMEITAHAGARPSHAMWQGQIVSLSGKRGYLSVNDIGYGSASGFKGCNCRHDWYPYFEGISQRAYSNTDLQALENERITYNGKEYSEYEITQLQRQAERSIRESKRRLAGYDEAIKNCENPQIKAQLQAEFNTESIKLKAKEYKLQDLCDKTNSRKDNARVWVNGFGKSTAQKAVWANKKYVANSNNNGIINTRNVTNRNMANGMRKSVNIKLSENDKKHLLSEIEAINADKNIFVFRDGFGSGYSDERDKIFVSSNIFPSNDGSNHPRDLMSERAALAHEYYGHRTYRGTKLQKGSWNDEFRASYMAAKNCPNLTDEDRYYLVLDALERAKEKGVSITYNDFIRRILYGY